MYVNIKTLEQLWIYIISGLLIPLKVNFKKYQ